MLAKAVTDVPAPDAVEGGYSYEPKWDGFRCIVRKEGDDVELVSRGKKPLTRYFPEVVAACRALLPEPCLIDGEIVAPCWAAMRLMAGPSASSFSRSTVVLTG